MVGLPPVALPRVIGHRGAAAYAPENTLAGFRKAAALGVRWVEFDVRLTSDGRLALLHDATLDRTTNGSGALRQVNSRALARLDAGDWFGPDFTGEPVPLLDAAIPLLLDLGLGANIEMKCDPGMAAATAEALAAGLAERWPADADPPLVSSFDLAAMARFRDVAANRPRGFLIEALKRGWRAEFDALAPATLHVGVRRLTSAKVEEARSAGVPVVVYTVNDETAARTFFSWGVDALISDAPDVVTRAL